MPTFSQFLGRFTRRRSGWYPHRVPLQTETFASTPEPDTGPLEYRRSWLIHAGEEGEAPVGWSSYPLGSTRRLSVHPSTRLARASAPGYEVVFVGAPIDIEGGTVDAAGIAGSLADLLFRTQSDEAALKRVAYLGGRFVCLFVKIESEELQVATDCAATMPVYWAHGSAGEFFASTHASLCAKSAEKGVDAKAKSLLGRARDMRTPGTLFLPGIMTGYEGVYQVLPNHRMRVSAAGSASHERYYPFTDTSSQGGTEQAYERFRDTFMRHVELIASLGTLGVSLTGGRDSRATLAASLPHFTDDSLTWTYINSTKPHPDHLADHTVAADLAQRVNAPHLQVDLAEPHNEEAIRAHRITIGASAQMPRVSWAYSEQLPPNMIELQSMAAEIGTGFYKNRRGKATVPRLAELYARGDFSELPEVREEIEKFVDYADFREELFGDVDFHDLYYWEHRLGRWGSRRIQEIDLTHPVILPFNSREIVESLRCKSLDSRQEKQDLVRFVSDVNPALED